MAKKQVFCRASGLEISNLLRLRDHQIILKKCENASPPTTSSTFVAKRHQAMNFSQPTDLQDTFNEKGERISPVLPSSVKNFLIDIDGTICDDVPNEEPERMGIVLPYPDALQMLNLWYDQGHIIFFFTSRTEAHRTVTEEWLNRHGFKYHGIIFGKPRGGNYHWIDNHIVRATRFKGKFTDLVVKNQEIEVFSE